MKTKIFVLILLVFSLKSSLLASQTNQLIIDTNNVSKTELLNTINQSQALIDSARTTFSMSKETYQLSKEYMEHSMNTDDKFFKWIGVLLGFLTITGISGFVVFYKSLLKRVANKQDENYRQLSSENANIIKTLIEKHISEDSLHKKSKIIVFNIKGTPIDKELRRVIDVFTDYSIIDIKNFELNSIETEIRKLALAHVNAFIIEDSEGSLLEKYETTEKVEQHMIPIVNSICKDHILFYFGKFKFSEKFHSGVIYKNNLGFANFAAQFYGNLMNLLKFHSITKNK